MAYIAQDDKLQQDGQAPNVDYPQAQPLQGGGASADVGSGGGGSASTAGIGAGGTGGWTNVQSYLDANKGGTGSAQALSNTVGTQFDQEKKTMSDASQGFLQDSQKQVDDAKVSNEQADQAINQAAGTYQWDGSANDDYNKNVEKMRGSLTNAYSGPTSYSYGFTAPTQQYATGLKDNGAFDGVMNDVYGKSAGKELTRGQFDLQKQLDVNNEGLSNARQQLLERYNGLEGERDSTVKDTTEKLGGLAQQYRKNQAGLYDYLGQKANTYDTATSQLENDARKAYQQTYTGEHSGRGNVFAPTMSGDVLNRGGGTENLADRGVWGDRRGSDLTWQELEREQGLGNKGIGGDWSDHFYGAFANPRFGGNAPERQTLDRFKESGSTLNNFFSAQNDKYKDTADSEKRSYNSILDFLNNNGSKKSQGFKVKV